MIRCMQIMPNKTVLTGTVNKVVAAADGWGAELDVTVHKSSPVKGYADFLGTEPGASLKLFVADSEQLRPGQDYRLTATVLGGPTGERIVVEAARPLKARPER